MTSREFLIPPARIGQRARDANARSNATIADHLGTLLGCGAYSLQSDQPWLDRMKRIDKDHQASRIIGKWMIVEAIVIAVLTLGAMLYRHFFQS